ncbi:hypothetical protein ABI062_15475, partial [Enterococcus faecium]|uniref:hypothetical protein n=1 Tax=Enterococcus faecium TaxID=1352 RepID=UPI003F430014
VSPMGSSTKVLLPVALLFAVIFGITFISSNSNTAVDPVKTATPTVKKREEPLIFPLVAAEPDRKSPNPAIRTMTLDWEVGSPGHFDFW